MTWNINCVPQEKQKYSQWSGGTTTELALYPPNSSYAHRDFLWRISTAMVDMETSTFTNLPAYNRLIMPLRGSGLQLYHEGHHNKSLALLETDAFHGSWATTSVGKVQDFNLMYMDTCKGSMHGYLLTEELILNSEPDKEAGNGTRMFMALYFLGGVAELEVPELDYKMTIPDKLFLSFTGEVYDKHFTIKLKAGAHSTPVTVAVVKVIY